MIVPPDAAVTGLTRFNAILGSLFVVVVIIGPPQDALFGAVLPVNTGSGWRRNCGPSGRLTGWRS